MLDRLLHRSVVLNLDGDSYRLRAHHAANDTLRHRKMPTKPGSDYPTRVALHDSPGDLLPLDHRQHHTTTHHATSTTPDHIGDDALTHLLRP